MSVKLRKAEISLSTTSEYDNIKITLWPDAKSGDMNCIADKNVKIDGLISPEDLDSVSDITRRLCELIGALNHTELHDIDSIAADIRNGNGHSVLDSEEAF